MTDAVAARVPDIGTLIVLRTWLLRWLHDEAWPCWDARGVDRGSSGGYLETLDRAGFGAMSGTSAVVDAADVRRGRVVSRQIYAFDVAHRLGWRSVVGTNPVEHGGRFLLARLHAGGGEFHAAYDVQAGKSLPVFSLYERAFYLFALTCLGDSPVDPSRLGVANAGDLAEASLRQLRKSWGRTLGGFEESIPPTVPLKSNPHMHLLEAALAWIDITRGVRQRLWLELARELVSLCMTHFIDPVNGAVRENFDSQWGPMAGDAGRMVEPGHQFEWAWLLMRWSASEHCASDDRAALRRAALRLIDIGERWGVDPIRGLAVNEIWDDMTVKDKSAKLWPQTERIKAWCAALEHAQSTVESNRASRKIESAVRGLMRYLREDAPGMWHEVCDANGIFVEGPSKASSFYHIVCAIDVLRRTVAMIS